MIYYLSYDWNGRVRRVHFDKVEAMTATAKQMTQGTVPEEWEMFTTKGNRRLANLAQQFVTHLGNGVSLQEAARTFFRSFAKLWKTKTMAEAMDTAVREAVWDFAMRFKDLSNAGEDGLERLWEETCS